MILIFQAMRETTYLSRVVEFQKDKGRKVTTTGPYRYAHHLMYAGGIVFFLCISLALGPLWALIPSTLLTGLIVARTHLEDWAQHAELKGYTTYAQQVKFRHDPGIW